MSLTLKKSLVTLAGLCCLGLNASGAQFTGPAEWRMVHTNKVAAWQAEQTQKVPPACVWHGVVADKTKGEVRILAEAVGHASGITAEFLMVGPFSDRAYEAAAVSVAMPSDIVRAVEALGIRRGACVGSRPYRFWPCGERFSATLRELPDTHTRPLQSILHDVDKENPLIGSGGLVFTGSRWQGDNCAADTNMPCAIISLYNAGETLFDVPFQAGQSEVYGRLSLAHSFACGALLEIVLRPIVTHDGKPRVLPMTIKATIQEDALHLACQDSSGTTLQQGELATVLAWLRTKSEAERDIFVTLEIDDAMPLKRAVDVARIFTMLDGKGVKLDGRSDNGLYPKAFTPLEKWREHKDRHPQPFELHLTSNSDGVIEKKLVFIEEDWSVAGLDPALTPRDYPFNEWRELPALIEKCGGKESKVNLLFVFAPADQPLSLFMPGVRAVAERLNLVYIFTE